MTLTGAHKMGTTAHCDELWFSALPSQGRCGKMNVARRHQLEEFTRDHHLPHSPWRDLME